MVLLWFGFVIVMCMFMFMFMFMLMLMFCLFASLVFVVHHPRHRRRHFLGRQKGALPLASHLGDIHWSLGVSG